MADRLVLASSSPRRVELLRLAGIEPVVRPPHVDERRDVGEEPLTYAARVAARKLEAVARAPDETVVAADTVVVLDGETLGKPVDAPDATAMLRRLSGREHVVATAVCAHGPGGRGACTVTTRVRFAPLDHDLLVRYVASGEPLDKAGAYGIQGRGAVLVRELVGSWTNVVGLPVVETLELLRAVGWDGGDPAPALSRPERPRPAAP